MNKTYKVIWSEVTQSFIAVFEFAKGKSKASKSVLLLMTLTICSDAVIAAEDADIKLGNEAAIEGTWNVLTNAAERRTGLGFGYDKTLPQPTALRGLNIGNHSTSGSGSMAIGEYTVANLVGSMAIGQVATTLSRTALALGPGAYVAADSVSAMALGAWSASRGMGALSYGASSTADGNGAVAMGYSAYAGKQGSIAIGSAATQAGKIDTDFNRDESTYVDSAMAVGVGHNVKIGTEADSSVALGDGAVIKNGAKNAVALGAGSVADVANTVSVGSQGAERKITNVADGVLKAGSTEAVTGSQLFATDTAVKASADAIGVNTADIATNRAAIGTNTATIAAQGTTLAQQGGQLRGLATSLGGGAAVNADGSFKSPVFTVQGGSQSTVSDALRALDTSVSGNTKDITASKSAISTNTAAIAANQSAIGVNTADIAANRTAIGANTATIAAQGTTLAQQGGQLRGLATSLGGGAAVNADGSFTAPAFTVQGTSQNTVSDALRALDTTVTGNTRDIGDLQLSLNSGTTGLVRQDEASGAITVAAASGGRSVSLAGTDGTRTLSGVKDANLAAGSSEAVTGSQLFQSYTHMNQLAEALGGGSSVDIGDDTRRNSGFRFIAPTFTVQGQNKHTVSDALNVLDGAVTDNSNVINGLMSGSHGLVQLGAGGDIITIASNSGGKLLNVAGNAGSRVVTGVANGEVSATSTDAVNGSQLHEINAQVAKNTTDINQLSDSVVGVISGKSGLVQQEKSDAVVEIAHNSGGKTVSVDGTDGNRRISGVSDGISDDDAATVAQLKSIKVEMGSASMVAMNSDTASKPKADGKDAIALGANASAGSTSGVAIGSSASSQGEQSVALGNGSSAKGSQSLALGNGSNATAKNAVALGSDSVASEENTVSVGSSTNQRRITNVARGVNNSDVVTVGQMNDGFASLQNYTNHEINKVNKRIERVENKLTAGIASAMALSGIPQAYQPDSSLLGAAVSSYGNASAIAVGLSHISENGRWITKLQASGNTESDFGGSVGIGFQW